MQCCRTHYGTHADAAAVQSTFKEPYKSADAGAEAENSFSFSSVDCLFNSEEDVGEAIIDTGASRAVIGEQRLQGMLDSLPEGLRKMTYRARTPGVVFKFGNSSKLTSRFAILLPRSEKGWLRVEVVPGQTPFLISNSILRGLRGVVDVEDQVLRFKGSPRVIPLHACRKSLLSVKVSELLSCAPSGKMSSDTETIMHVDKVQGHEGCTESQEHDEHEGCTTHEGRAYHIPTTTWMLMNAYSNKER